ncbi:hypothetical protein Tco_0071634 [Tanacetum coccineum]
MVAFLEKTNGNAEFHEIIDFLTRSSIHYALTVSFVVSTMFVEQFWMTAKSKTINNVRYITATVADKPVSISEASIRKDECAVLERPSETQPTPSPTHPSEDHSEPQPDPFLRPSSSNPIPNSILECSGGNHGECFHEETIGKEEVFEDKVDAEGVSFDDLDDAMDYMETEDAHDEGTVKKQESILTLKPLPKIDPKDKGKKVLKEKAESDAESEGVNEAERKFAQLANNEGNSRKGSGGNGSRRERRSGGYEKEATKAALIRDYDDIQARIEADSILAARLQE